MIELTPEGGIIIECPDGTDTGGNTGGGGGGEGSSGPTVTGDDDDTTHSGPAGSPNDTPEDGRVVTFWYTSDKVVRIA